MSKTPPKTDDTPPAEELERLFAELCNGTLEPADRLALDERLAADAEAREAYVRYMDLHASLHFCPLGASADGHSQPELQGIDLALSTPAAYAADDSAAKTPSEEAPHEQVVRGRTRFTSRLVSAPASYLLLAVGTASMVASVWVNSRLPQATQSPASVAEAAAIETSVATLQGAVGARWGGAALTIPEGAPIEAGRRLDLVEGLADIAFRGGGHLIVQGPAILHIVGECEAEACVGRFAVRTSADGKPFTLRTKDATLTTNASQFGAEVEVDGSIVTRVYQGEIALKAGSVDAVGEGSAVALRLSEGDGVRYAADAGMVNRIDEPENYTFVRFLPVHETLINLADIVAGGSGQGRAHHRGVSLVDGAPTDDYDEPTASDGEYRWVSAAPFIDGVFIPGNEPDGTQVDSLGRRFDGFGATSGDCWGGAVMARRPSEERSLPFIRLEFHGNNYGYVNWLHTASNPEELTPDGFGMIGMHANCGITFDLHAIRAKHPRRKVVRFRSVVGSLESRSERHEIDAWVIVDGELRARRLAFSREDGAETIEIPLSDQDRFLVLAVTDSGGDTAYDWGAFGDPVIEMTTIDRPERSSASASPRRKLSEGPDTPSHFGGWGPHLISPTPSTELAQIGVGPRS